jgi:O-antigen/teichoic acid export membrane protein
VEAYLIAAFLDRARARLGAHGPLVANTSWQIGDRLFRLVVGFLVSVWVVRYLGPEDFGRLSYALAFVSLFYPFANLGLDPIAIRELVRRPEDRGAILGSTLAMKLVGGVVALAAALAVVAALNHDRSTLVLAAICGASFIPQATDAFESWFQARLEVFRVVLARNAGLLVASLLRVAFIMASLSVVAFAWAGMVEIAVAAVGLALAYVASGAGVGSRLRYDRAEARGLLADGWPFIISNAMIMIYMRIDQLMLGRMVGVAELGVYSVAVRLTEVWYVLAMAVVSSVFPSVVRAREAGEEIFHARLQRLYALMALAGYAIALPVTLLARPIVALTFGGAYRGAGPVLQVLIWTVLFTNLGVARSSYLTAMNWAKVHVVTVAAGAAANVALNLVLIPRWGGLGAAIATLVAQALAAYGSCFLVPRLRRTGIMLTRALVVPRPW